jgi:hypothetical protein
MITNQMSLYLDQNIANSLEE